MFIYSKRGVNMNFSDIQSAISIAKLIKALYFRYKELAVLALYIACICLGVFNWYSYQLLKRQTEQLDRLVTILDNVENNAARKALTVRAEMEVAQMFAGDLQFHEIIHRLSKADTETLISKQIVCSLDRGWYTEFLTSEEVTRYCRIGNLPYIDSLIHELDINPVDTLAEAYTEIYVNLSEEF